MNLAQRQIRDLQIDNNYPTSYDTTLQIDYDKFGGQKIYNLSRDIYWMRYNTGWNIQKLANIFNIEKKEAIKLIKSFNKELHSPIRFYEENN